VPYNPASPFPPDEKITNSPFDQADFSDVIFRTPNNVVLFLKRAVLEISSEFFKSMSPPPQLLKEVEEMLIIDAPEDERLLDLPRHCYPIWAPALLKSFEQFLEIMEIAYKYDLRCVVSRLIQQYL
jgi:hypothetical protein